MFLISFGPRVPRQQAVADLIAMESKHPEVLYCSLFSLTIIEPPLVIPIFGPWLNMAILVT